MKKIYLIVLSTFLIVANAQESVTVSGGNVSSGSGVISYSVGQLVYKMVSTPANGSVNQGMQQLFEIKTLGTDYFSRMTLSMYVYPNPTTSILNLKIADYPIENLKIQLTNMLGKIMHQQKTTSDETLIPMEGFCSGAYLLQVTENNTILKTFKIIKN